MSELSRSTSNFINFVSEDKRNPKLEYCYFGYRIGETVYPCFLEVFNDQRAIGYCVGISPTSSHYLQNPYEIKAAEDEEYCVVREFPQKMIDDLFNLENKEEELAHTFMSNYRFLGYLSNSLDPKEAKRKCFQVAESLNETSQTSNCLN